MMMEFSGKDELGFDEIRNGCLFVHHCWGLALGAV